jgi:isopentenyl-diphosphate delta-isomerase
MNRKWISIEDLKIDMKNNPENYTKWFYIIVKDYFDKVFL